MKTSLKAPFAGPRALGALAALVQWESEGSARDVVPITRSTSDEAAYAQRTLQQLGLESKVPMLSRLITLDAPPADYAAWRTCKLQQPGILLAPTRQAPGGLFVEVLWNPPAGTPPGSQLESYLPDPWISAFNVPAAIFPKTTLNGPIYWEAFLRNRITTPYELNASAWVGRQAINTLVIPPLGNVAGLVYPRRRESIAMSASYAGRVNPEAGGAGQLPGEHLWSTSAGCHVGAFNSRRALATENAYRIEWSGACQEGWIHGRGTLRWYDARDLSQVYIGDFDRGDFVTGDDWWIGNDPETDAPKSIIHWVNAGNRRTKQESQSGQDAMDWTDSPSELRAAFERKGRLYATTHPGYRVPTATPVAAPAAQMRSSDEGPGALVTGLSVLNQLVGAATQVIEAKNLNQREQRAQARFNESARTGNIAQSNQALKEMDAVRADRLNSTLRDETARKAASLDREFSSLRRTPGEDVITADRCLLEQVSATPTSNPEAPWIRTYQCATPATYFHCSADNKLYERYLKTEAPQRCSPQKDLSQGSVLATPREIYNIQHPNPGGWVNEGLVCFRGSSAYMNLRSDNGRGYISSYCRWD